MGDINWSLATQPSSFENALAKGFQIGQHIKQQRDEKEYKNALATVFGGGQGTVLRNPDNPTVPDEGNRALPDSAAVMQQAKATLARHNPQLAMEIQQREARDAAGRQQTQQADMATFRKLLSHAAQSPEGWAQALGAAQNMGLDVSRVPQQYDPQWAQQQLFIMDAVEKTDPEELKGIAYELEMAGFKPGTPEFEEAARSVISNKYATEYVDENGNTRRRSALNLQPAQGGPQPGAVEDGYRFKGGNPADPSSWEPVAQGGQTATPSATFSGSFRPVGINQAGITSTYRTPQHNREVGGVRDSYHTRRGPNGEPLAIDSVPPRGMSMSAYAAKLRRENPNLDVINEGDHVHVEPRG